MNNEIIKQALAYSLGEDIHEEWRKPRKLEDGTYEPRIKKSNDEVWNNIHGTNEVDIANCSFKELPSNWQYENLEAAKVAINLVYDDIINNKELNDEEIEIKAAIVHEEWLKRNDWVYDQTYGNPLLVLPYGELSEEEKEKDRIQVISGIKKTQDYLNNKININDIISTYNIEISTKTL